MSPAPAPTTSRFRTVAAVAAGAGLFAGGVTAGSVTAVSPAQPQPVYQVITDDTSTIAAAVPATWTDVTTAPDEDGMAQILAFSADSASTLMYAAAEPWASLDDEVDDAIFQLSNECDDEPRIEPFHNQWYAGTMVHWPACGGTLDEVMTLSLEGHGGERYARALIGITPADGVTAFTIAESLGLAGEVTAPDPTAMPTTPTGAPATTAPGQTTAPGKTTGPGQTNHV